MSSRVMMVAGGTGGHVYPALAIAEALLRLEPEVQIRFVGGRRGIEGRLVPEHGFELKKFPASGLRGAGLLGAVMFFVNFFESALRSLSFVLTWRPRIVVATGGYASAAPSVVAALLGVPLWLQEQNSAPGSTNRVLARFAERAYVAFAPAGPILSAAKSVIEMPNPVREELRCSASGEPSDADYEAYGLTADRPTLFVFGGSRGAATLNAAVLEAWPQLKDRTEWQVLLQTGDQDLESTRAVVNRADDDTSRARVLSYIDDMAAAYRVADLVVCRAGALTLAELAVAGKPAILVPFPHATDDHQRLNARVVEAAGAARCVDDADFDGARLLAEIEDLGRDRGQLKAMGQAARVWAGERDGAGEIARAILDRIHGESTT